MERRRPHLLSALRHFSFVISPLPSIVAKYIDPSDSVETDSEIVIDLTKPEKPPPPNPQHTTPSEQPAQATEQPSQTIAQPPLCHPIVRKIRHVAYSCYFYGVPILLFVLAVSVFFGANVGLVMFLYSTSSVLVKGTVTVVLHQKYSVLLILPLALEYGILMLYRRYPSIDKKATLSLTAQTMHLSRTRKRSDITLPLDQVVAFSGKRRLPSVDLNRFFYIHVETTGHPLEFGCCTESYETVVSRLNDFLRRSRASNATPTPHAPLRAHVPGKIRLTRPALVATQLPDSSKLSFQALDGSTFNCTRRHKFPIVTVKFLTTGFVYCVCAGLLSLFSGPIASVFTLARDPSFVLACLASGGPVLALLYFNVLPATWTFSVQSEPVSRASRFMRRLCGLYHVPVRMFRYVEVDVRESWWGLKFVARFISDEGREQGVYGLSEGEILILGRWLLERFPHLFDDEDECKGDETRALVGDSSPSVGSKRNSLRMRRSNTSQQDGASRDA